MSAVTAAILVGSTPRTGAGTNPRWIAFLHEGKSYAWQLLHLQLTGPEVGDHSRDAPPGVLWRASAFEDLAGELALLLHLYATRTPEVVSLARRVRHIQRRRVDLMGLEGIEKDEFENLLRVARERGRELRLAAFLYPGSRLTDDHLLSLPDWELDVGYPAFSRDWTNAGGGQLVVHDATTNADELPDAGFSAADEAEFTAQRQQFIAPRGTERQTESATPSVSAVQRVREALERSDVLDQRTAREVATRAVHSDADTWLTHGDEWDEEQQRQSVVEKLW